MDYNTDQNGYFTTEKSVSGDSLQKGAAIYLSKVMGWMCMGLFTTFVTTLLCLSNDSVMNMILSSRASLYGFFIVQIVVVLGLSFMINKLSPAAATVLFMLYSALTGVTMSMLAGLFTLGSISVVFITTTVIFLGLSFYGFATKRDLTKIGTLAFFGLLGLIVGGLVNMFLRNTMMDFIITCVGILVFIILIAYDTQKIKNLYYNMAGSGYSDESPELRKLAIIGALTLYLDFINLFLKLLKIMGKRK